MLPFEIKDKRPDAGEMFIYTCVANFLNLIPFNAVGTIFSTVRGGIGEDKTPI